MSRSDRSASSLPVAGVLSLAPTEAATITTRRDLRRTRLGPRRSVIAPNAADDARPSIVTRRRAWLRRRRRKRMLLAVAAVLALFPPMWAVYLVAWLVWRTRPRQASMRQVRKAVRALEKEQTGVALQRLQAAHYRDPSNNDALYWLGLLMSRQGRQEEAAEALSLVAERVPGLPEVEAALVDAYVATQDAESAVHHAQRLLDAAPYDPASLVKLSEAFEAAGRLDLAVGALEQAPLHKPTLTPALADLHYRLGDLQLRRGDAEQARHHFERVYAWDVTFRDVRDRLDGLADDA